MTIKQYIRQYFFWSTFEPADEREQQLYYKARMQSFYFLIGELILVPWITQNAVVKLTTVQTYLYLTVFIIFILLIAEWVGGYALRGQDIAWSSKKLSWNKDFRWEMILLLLIVMVLGYLGISVVAHYRGVIESSLQNATSWLMFLAPYTEKASFIVNLIPIFFLGLIVVLLLVQKIKQKRRKP